MIVYYVNGRGRGPDDIGGLGEEKPGEIQQEDDEFDLYRKRMMLAYRFRPNPLVSLFGFEVLTCQNYQTVIFNLLFSALQVFLSE